MTNGLDYGPEFDSLWRKVEDAPGDDAIKIVLINWLEDNGLDGALVAGLRYAIQYAFWPLLQGRQTPWTDREQWMAVIDTSGAIHNGMHSLFGVPPHFLVHIRKRFGIANKYGQTVHTCLYADNPFTILRMVGWAANYPESMDWDTSKYGY